MSRREKAKPGTSVCPPAACMSVQSSVFHGSPIKLFVPMPQPKEGQTQSTSGPRHGPKGPKRGRMSAEAPSTAPGEQARRESLGERVQPGRVGKVPPGRGEAVATPGECNPTQDPELPETPNLLRVEPKALRQGCARGSQGKTVTL